MHQIQQDSMKKVRRTRTRRGNRDSKESCFYCFRNGRACEQPVREGPCLNCRHKIDGIKPLQLVPCLHESGVRTILDDVVGTLCPLQIQFDQNVESTLHISVIAQSKNEKPIKLKKPNTQITIIGPFFPHNRTLCGQMDAFVHDTLGLQMESTDPTSTWVRDVSLAGGYLAFIFPVAKKTGTSTTSLVTKPASEDHLKRHITKFSIIRFGELLESIIIALRSMNRVSDGHNIALNLIAAAGVLYFELESVNQRFQSGTATFLFGHSELETAIREWLKMAGKEILSRLQATCGQFPWAKNLVPPRKGAKRNFDVREIILTMSTTLQSETIHSDIELSTPYDSQSSSAASELSPAYMAPVQAPFTDEDEAQVYNPANEDELWSPPPISKGFGDIFLGESFSSSINQHTYLLIDSTPYSYLDVFGLPNMSKANQQHCIDGQHAMSANDHEFSFDSPFGMSNVYATSPTLQVLGTSNHFPSEIEQFANHVSGPLPFFNSTREETSVEATDDLFLLNL